MMALYNMIQKKRQIGKKQTKKARPPSLFNWDAYYNHIQSSCVFLHPYTPLPLPLWSPLLAAAAPCIGPPVAGGRQVLVDGSAVGNKTHPQLEVSGQATEGCESQDQQGGEQQEAHNQQSHAAPVIQDVWAVQRSAVGLHRGVAEEAEYDHG